MIYLFIILIVALMGVFYGGYDLSEKFVIVSALTAAATCLHAIYDGKRIRLEEYIEDHTGRFIFRSVYLAVCALVVVGRFDPIVIAVFFNQAALFGIFFDPMVNIETGQMLFYHGGTAWYDKLIRRHPRKAIIIEILIYLFTLYLIIDHVR